MGSLNPVVVVTAAAIAARGEAIATALAGAITRERAASCARSRAPRARACGSERARAHGARWGKRWRPRTPTVMLNERLRVDALAKIGQLRDAARAACAELGAGTVAAAGEGEVSHGSCSAPPPRAIRADPRLLEERFGPIALLASYEDTDDLLGFTLARLPGQLTATLHVQDGDELRGGGGRRCALLSRVGRLVLQRRPDGRRGDRPRCSTGGRTRRRRRRRTTSVGLAAIERFLRPVVWQDARPTGCCPTRCATAKPAGRAAHRGRRRAAVDGARCLRSHCLRSHCLRSHCLRSHCLRSHCLRSCARDRLTAAADLRETIRRVLSATRFSAVALADDGRPGARRGGTRGARGTAGRGTVDGRPRRAAAHPARPGGERAPGPAGASRPAAAPACLHRRRRPGPLRRCACMTARAP